MTFIGKEAAEKLLEGMLAQGADVSDLSVFCFENGDRVAARRAVLPREGYGIQRVIFFNLRSRGVIQSGIRTWGLTG
jgi:hypothetical protein